VLVSIDTTLASFVQLRSNGQPEPNGSGLTVSGLEIYFFGKVEPNFTSSPGVYFRRIDREETPVQYAEKFCVSRPSRQINPGNSWRSGLGMFDHEVTIGALDAVEIAVAPWTWPFAAARTSAQAFCVRSTCMPPSRRACRDSPFNTPQNGN
jgi:hypothetical protein